MDETFFAGLEIEEVTLPSGLHVNLPIRYYDVTCPWAVFPADAAKVQQQLLPGGLRPVELAPGVAGILLYGLECRRADGLVPYNEFAITVLAMHETVQTPGGLSSYYFHRLPLTTADALEAGIEIWGFPKTIADINFEDDERVSRCRVRADGKDMVTLEIQKLPTAFAAWDSGAFTVREDELLWTRILRQGQRGVSQVKGGASCRLGDHPFAEELRAVGMDLVSVSHGYQPQYQFILPQAEVRLPLRPKEKVLAR